MASNFDLDALFVLAQAAQAKAYAPYSRFRVGAALAVGGQHFFGANMENASYGLCVCAERNAMAAAIAAGHQDLDAIVVVSSSSPPASPCGMCRQVLVEFARHPERVRVIAANPTTGERAEWTLAELLPHHFSGRQLGVVP